MASPPRLKKVEVTSPAFSLSLSLSRSIYALYMYVCLSFSLPPSLLIYIYIWMCVYIHIICILMNMYVCDGTDTCVNYSLNSSTEMGLCTLKVAGGLHVSLTKEGIEILNYLRSQTWHPPCHLRSYRCHPHPTWRGYYNTYEGWGGIPISLPPCLSRCVYIHICIYVYVYTHVPI
jgi:hypothetical protein